MDRNKATNVSIHYVEAKQQQAYLNRKTGRLLDTNKPTLAEELDTEITKLIDSGLPPSPTVTVVVKPTWVASTTLMLAVLREQSIRKDVSTRRTFDMIADELLHMAEVADLYVVYVASV